MPTYSLWQRLDDILPIVRLQPEYLLKIESHHTQMAQPDSKRLSPNALMPSLGILSEVSTFHDFP